MEGTEDRETRLGKSQRRLYALIDEVALNELDGERGLAHTATANDDELVPETQYRAKLQQRSRSSSVSRDAGLYTWANELTKCQF